MSAETLENYKKFSSAIPYSLALGQDAEAPLHKDTNDELMAQLKAHPFIQNVDDGIWKAMAVTLERCMYVPIPDSPERIEQARRDKAEAIAGYNRSFKQLIGADIEDLYKNLNYANELGKRTDPPLTQWERDYCVAIKARGDKVGLLAREMAAYGVEKTAAPQQRQTGSSDPVLRAMADFKVDSIDFADLKYGTRQQLNADAVINELVRGGFSKEHLKGLKLDIQRITLGAPGRENRR
jgi:hypothetical protein